MGKTPCGTCFDIPIYNLSRISGTPLVVVLPPNAHFTRISSVLVDSFVRVVRFQHCAPLPLPGHPFFCLDKTNFVLPRYSGLDVRGLLEQDLLLLRALCLSPIASAAAGVVESAADERDRKDIARRSEGRDEEEEALEVVRCWRLHVELLLSILKRVPAAADDSLAVVEHLTLPCLEIFAAICLDGLEYPSLRENDVLAAADEVVVGYKVEDLALRGVLQASADSWTRSMLPNAARGVRWATPSQMRNAKLVRDAWRRLASVASHSTADSKASQTSDSMDSMSVHRSAAGPSKRLSSLFPEHWLLRLMTCGQSPVLRRFSGMILGALAASKGQQCSDDVAEVAAHLLGFVAAEGSEAAALQVRLSQCGKRKTKKTRSGSPQIYGSPRLHPSSFLY